MKKNIYKIVGLLLLLPLFSATNIMGASKRLCEMVVHVETKLYHCGWRS